MAKVYKSQFGRKYIFPAEYDILVNFSPLSLKSSNDVDALDNLDAMGLAIQAQWIANYDSYKNDDTVTIVDRLPPLDNPETEEVETVPVADPESETDGVELTDDSVLPDIEERESEIDDSELAKKWNWDDWSQ